VGATALALLAAAPLPGCRSGQKDLLLTYFNPEHGVSLRYPSTWKVEQAQQDGVSYRYFSGPPTGPARKPSVTVTLVAGALGMTLDEYARTYVAGNPVESTSDEARPGARGKQYRFASADGKTRYALLLLEENAAERTGLPPTPAPRATVKPSAAVGAGTVMTVRPSPTPIPIPSPAPAGEPSSWVYGLFAQGERPGFESEKAHIDEMLKSFALERTAAYTEERNEKFGFTLRVPPTWRSARSFASADTFLQQYTSPAMGTDKKQTVHASLTLTVEPVGGDGSADTYYRTTMDKLGDTVVSLSHTPWRGGYVDVLHSETPVAVTRGKRYFRTAFGHGYTLACEGRDDIFPRVSRWCDMIAATLDVGPEVKHP
jgi:hypothetical protein